MKKITENFVAFMLTMILTIAFSFAANCQDKPFFYLLPKDGNHYATTSANADFTLAFEKDGSSYIAFRGVSEEYVKGHAVWLNNCTGEKTFMPTENYATYDHELGVLFIRMTTGIEATLEVIEGNISMLSIAKPNGKDPVDLDLQNISLCLQMIVNAVCPACNVPEPSCSSAKI